MIILLKELRVWGGAVLRHLTYMPLLFDQNTETPSLRILYISEKPTLMTKAEITWELPTAFLKGKHAYEAAVQFLWQPVQFNAVQRQMRRQCIMSQSTQSSTWSFSKLEQLVSFHFTSKREGEIRDECSEWAVALWRNNEWTKQLTLQTYVVTDSITILAPKTH
jgi:hypothetical protein